MKTSLTFLSCAALFTGWASAELPKKMPVGRYSGLWMSSPFTSKPPPPGPMVEGNPLEDYALIGVSPIAGGYRVSLINKKNPEERVLVDSDNPASKFKILNVTRKPGDPLGTVVRLTSGSVTGTVTYDEKLLTLAAPAAKAAAPGQPPQPGQPPMPGQPPNPNNPQRQPRPRVVPPPSPQGAPQGVPQAQPQPQQIPQVQQGQPAQQNNNGNRPGRRRN
ncbi:MAG: hypothetical protein ABIT37_10280 [Luteolibacter sp.]